MSLSPLLPLLLVVLVIQTLYAGERHITITIDYGGALPERTVTATLHDGATALQLLQKVARVTTKQVGTFLFVRSVDGVKGEPGKMGWFYAVDGRPAKELAVIRKMDGAATMRWYYAVEACY